MNLTASQNKKGYIRSSTLILLAFIITFYPRVLTLLKFPSIVNLLHLGIVPLICGFILSKTQIRSKRQVAISKAILFGLVILFTVMVASALLNGAGAINVVVDFILLGEPFILLVALISIAISSANTERLRTLLICSGFLNTLFALVQYHILNLHLLPGREDNIKGIFIAQGAGHVVSASVALTFGLHYFVSAKTVSIWIRISVVLATFWHMLIADAKQVLLTLLLAWLFLLLIKFNNIGRLLKYALAATVIISVLVWCIQNVPFFDAFNTWARPELYGPNGEATRVKLATFSIVPSYYHSPLNLWLGLGPGHTVGRLGGWMLIEYKDLLAPLGSTTHPATRAIGAIVGASWLGEQSSMFSPLFGWAGIWGDLGFLGLGAYLYLWFLVWRHLCSDDFSRFLVFSIFAFGLVFSQMEEPGYMLFVVSLIGLRWQENRLSSNNNTKYFKTE